MQMPYAINIGFAKHTVHRHHIFGMTVFYHSKITKFSLHRIFRGKHIAHLNVYGATLLLCHKVDFSFVKDANIDSITKSQKMTVDSVLH